MAIGSTVRMSDIGSIVSNSSNTTISMNDSLVRQLIGNTTGQISLSSAIGKPAAGNANYTSAGTWSWLVVPYKTLNVSVAGAGGGGGGGSTAFIYWYPGSPGAAGGNSSFSSTTSLFAGRGLGGGVQPSFGGAASTSMMGSASGGDTNTLGGGATGGAGGLGNGAPASQNGGNGGLAVKTWTHSSTSGYPVWGSSISLTVGAGGAGGSASAQGGTRGGNGNTGYVLISWS